MDYIIDPKNSRLNPYPIEFQDLWDFLNKQRSSVWFAEEVDLSKDDFSKLTQNEQFFVKMILAFFSQFDGIVNLNISEYLMDEVQIIEAKYNYRWQMAMEDIHADMYAILIETYIKNDEEKNKLRNAIDFFPILSEIREWGNAWLHQSSFAIKLLVNTIFEGIFFSAPFCLIFYLSQENKLPGLSKSNEFISRDEGMHTDFGIMLFKKLQSKPDEQLVHQIFNEAIVLKTKFIKDSLPVKLIGMSSENMIDYVKFISDRLLFNLGYSKIFNIKDNPFPFMDRIGLEAKNNFFESRTTEYQKAKFKKNKDINILDDF